jgi:hypothetical protein
VRFRYFEREKLIEVVGTADLESGIPEFLMSFVLGIDLQHVCIAWPCNLVPFAEKRKRWRTKYLSKYEGKSKIFRTGASIYTAVLVARSTDRW